MKNTIFIIITIIKVLIIIPGMAFVTLKLISWWRTKDRKKLKKAAIIFGGVFLSILVLTGIELIIAFN